MTATGRGKADHYDDFPTPACPSRSNPSRPDYPTERIEP